MRIIFLIFILISCSVMNVREEDKKNLKMDLLDNMQKKIKKIEEEKELAPRGDQDRSEGHNNEQESNPKARVRGSLKHEGGTSTSAPLVRLGTEKETSKIDLAEPVSNIENMIFSRRKIFEEIFNLRYVVKLMGVSMGYLDRYSKNLNPKKMILGGELKNRSIYRYLYSIDDRLETTITKINMKPSVVNLMKNENGASAISVQRDTFNKVIFHENSIKKGKKSHKERIVDFYGFYFDPLLFIRYIEIVNMDLVKNYRFPVIFRGKLYYMKVKSINSVRKRYEGKNIDVQRIAFDTYHNGKLKRDQKITLEKMGGENGRIFSMEGKMKVGMLYGELIQ